MIRRYTAAALLAGLLGLGPLTAVPAASAATCTDGRGVSVVVDFGALGGGVQDTCDSDGGGKKASEIFADSGFAISYAQRAAGFVCRVDGVPTSDPCINAAPADAYWGLWWSDGKTGEWVYASVGTASLSVPAGGSVGFAWNSGARTKPGVTPPVAAAAAPAAPSSPRPTPTTGGRPGGAAAAPPAASGAPSAGSGAGTPSAAATPGAEATTAPSAPAGNATRAPRRTEGTASDSPSDAAEAADAEEAGDTEATEEAATSTDDGGLPGWVVLAVLALVFGGAVVVAVRRRGATGR